jgi:hypothetical protein
VLQFHHSRELKYITHGIVNPVRLSTLSPEPQDCLQRGTCPDDEWHEAKVWMEPAYDWLKSHSGFYPLFLGVGPGKYAEQMTGYYKQFYRRSSWPEEVLFSFSDLGEPLVFQDYDYWCFTLGGCCKEGSHQREVNVDSYIEKLILKRSYAKSRWLKRARDEDGTVQATVPDLDLRQADLVRCRNQKTRRHLLELGFSEDQVKVERMRVPRY